MAVDGLLQHGKGALIPDIAQGNGYISEEAAAFSSENGGAGKAVAKPGVVQTEQLDEGGMSQFIAPLAPHEVSLPGKMIPGTRFQAIVTAKDAVTEGGTKFERDGAARLDGEIGEAAPGIELERSADSAGRAGVEAAFASSAAIFFRGIRSQGEGGDDFA